MRYAILFIVFLVVAECSAYAQMYKWVDEKGTIHFTDDHSKIPEKYRSEAESREMPKEVPVTQKKDRLPSPSGLQNTSESQGFDIPVKIKGDVAVAEVMLNGREKVECIVDTGASFTNISWKMAKNLGITIDESTPFIPVATASSLVLNPLVRLRSVSVGKAQVENVDVLISALPGDMGGLLGNSFLYKFKVVLEPMNGKMTLFPLQGGPSPDRPGGYGKDYWSNRFSFYHRILERLNKIKASYERQDSSGQTVNLNLVKRAIQYFENQLSELDRQASFAAVPRNWRE